MISIIDAGPRLPILGIAGNGLRFILVVAHSPHTEAELETVSAYWQHVHSILTAKYALTGMCSCFCRCELPVIGSTPKQLVGDYEAEKEGSKSEPFHAFLACQN